MPLIRKISITVNEYIDLSREKLNRWKYEYAGLENATKSWYCSLVRDSASRKFDRGLGAG